MTRIPGLRYYPDNRPGITRLRRGRGFSYLDTDGTRIDDKAERSRLAALAVPPAYEKVWISPFENGHLQATGYDTLARKQYRYHADWTQFRAERKFSQLAEFGRALSQIRRRVSSDLRAEAGDVTFATAAIVAMLDHLGLRIGSPDSVQEFGSYGATTLKPRHLKITGDGARLRFTAKGGKKVEAPLGPLRLNRMLQKMDDLPGGVLFRWIDEKGTPRPVTSEQVNQYLAEASGQEGITAKAFRTWNGTRAAFEVASSATETLTIVSMAETAATELHNTPTIARNSYIHPAVIDLAKLDCEERKEIISALKRETIPGLRLIETRLVAFLEQI